MHMCLIGFTCRVCGNSFRNSQNIFSAELMGNKTITRASKDIRFLEGCFPKYAHINVYKVSRVIWLKSRIRRQFLFMAGIYGLFWKLLYLGTCSESIIFRLSSLLMHYACVCMCVLVGFIFARFYSRSLCILLLRYRSEN